MDIEVHLEDGEVVIMRSTSEAFIFTTENPNVHTIAFVDNVLGRVTRLVRDRPGGVMWHQRNDNIVQNPNQGALNV